MSSLYRRLRYGRRLSACANRYRDVGWRK